ncbi:MAG: glycosyltransferase, partial [Campylobacterota bacterium]|nr:glycosyltransferase [Campylobacterota bacterium]
FPTLMSAITKDFSFFLKDYREFTFLLFFNYMKGKLLEDYTKSIDGKVLHYSYWMYEWSTILAILKNRRIINFLIARGHGNDIYMENYGKFNVIKNGITKTFGSYAIRFRNFELKNIDYLFPVSIHMEQYLHKKYPEYKHKINKMYLGVPDRGHNPSQMDIFRIATVSNVIPLKRVLRMIQVLKHINIEIEWHHFGSGPLFDTLKQQSEELQIDKNNISVKLHGHVPNNKLIEFYKKNHISVLINLSINEGGAPVSITEALSMGIPAIATDAGGNSETLHDKEYLIKNDFKDKEVAYKIMDIFKMDEKEYMQLRKKSKVHHKKFFGAESNYKEFISNIIFLYKEAR